MIKKSARQGVFLVVLVVLSLILFTSAAKLTDKQYQGLFQEFTKRYGKQYEVADLFERFKIFKENLDFIMDWNSNSKNTHTVAVNYFTDMTPEEWTKFKGLIVPTDFKEPDLVKSDDLSNTDLPENLKNMNIDLKEPGNFSWVEAGKVSPVRNQYTCGSCYSQTAVATIESAYAIKYDTEPPVLSVQQAVDCAGGRYGNQGCMGGWMMWVYKYVVDTGGLCTEEDYPYRNRLQSCRSAQCDRQVQITGYVNISGQSENTMVKATRINPLSIAVTSQTREFMFYKSGIINYCGSPRANLDHAVTLVGYGTSENGTDYWIVRNSWGSQWGEDGYVRIIRNKNMCKIRSNVSYPVIDTVG